MSRDYNYCIILSKTTTDCSIFERGSLSRLSLLSDSETPPHTVFLNQLSVTPVSHNTTLQYYEQQGKIRKSECHPVIIVGKEKEIE